MGLAARTCHVVTAGSQLDRCATFGTAFKSLAVFLLEFVKIDKSDQIVRILAIGASVPRHGASETVDLSALRAHTPFTFAFAFGTLDLRLAIWRWTPLLILVHHGGLDIV